MTRERRERIFIPAHASHSRTGRREHVRGHYVEREEPYPRHGIKFFHPKAHPGYSASLPIHTNVARGVGYARAHHIPQPYLHTGRELLALANVQERINPSASHHFREASNEAFRLHREGGR